ncbi:MAG: hypothetical protein H6869_01390 [Rhodospirillales bacterium]|nr:hypothetical protein [Rhodospirillales bacterium]
MGQFKKGVIGITFAAMAGMAGAVCCDDPLNAKPEDITFAPLNSVDIKIPVYNEKILEDGRVQFEINKKDFSMWRLLFSNTMGLYDRQQLESEVRSCPHINMPKGHLQKEFLDGGIIRITMQLNTAIIDVVKNHGCVVTDRTEDSDSPNNLIPGL